MTIIENFESFVEEYIDYPIDYDLIERILGKKHVVDYFYDDDTILAFFIWAAVTSVNMDFFIITPNKNYSEYLMRHVYKLLTKVEDITINHYKRNCITVNKGCRIYYGTNPIDLRSSTINYIFLYRSFEINTGILEDLLCNSLGSCRDALIVQADYLKDNDHLKLLKNYGIE